MAVAAQGPMEAIESRLGHVRADLHAGRPVLLRGRDGAEFVAAGRNLTADCVNTMVSHGRGVLRLAMPATRCRALGLKPQGVVRPGEAWTGVSVEARNGVTTGISTADRALTVRVVSDPNSREEDLSRPGHVVPIAVHDRGILARPRLAEAAVDLVASAGLGESAALCQVLDEYGDTAGPEAVDELASRGDYQLLEVEEVVDALRETSELPVLETFSIAELASGRVCTCTYDWSDRGRWHVALLGDFRAGEGRVGSTTQQEIATLLRGGREAEKVVADAMADGVNVLIAPLSDRSLFDEGDELVAALELDARDWLGRSMRRGC